MIPSNDHMICLETGCSEGSSKNVVQFNHTMQNLKTLICIRTVVKPHVSSTMNWRQWDLIDSFWLDDCEVDHPCLPAVPKSDRRHPSHDPGECKTETRVPTQTKRTTSFTDWHFGFEEVLGCSLMQSWSLRWTATFSTLMRDDTFLNGINSS